MWKRLADLSGVVANGLAAKRAAIQKRVEHIADAVARRHGGSDGEVDRGIDRRDVGGPTLGTTCLGRCRCHA